MNNVRLGRSDSSGMANQDNTQSGATVGDEVQNASARLSAEQIVLVEDNIALVHHIVGRITDGFPAKEQRDDLIQAGLLGLIEAAQRFDPDLGFSFSTFVGRRIEGAVLDLLRRSDWAPRSVRRNERQLHGITVDLTTLLGRPPTIAEVADAMGSSATDVHKIRADVARAQVNSLFDRRRANDDDPTGSSAELPASPEPERSDLEHKELMGYLRDAVSLLPERHRIVIIGHFLDGRSMTELGEFLGVTQSRASQLKSEALNMLKGGLEANLEDEPSQASEPKSKRQHAYEEAVGSASSWRTRVSGQSLARA